MSQWGYHSGWRQAETSPSPHTHKHTNTPQAFIHSRPNILSFCTNISFPLFRLHRSLFFFPNSLRPPLLLNPDADSLPVSNEFTAVSPQTLIVSSTRGETPVCSWNPGVDLLSVFYRTQSPDPQTSAFCVCPCWKKIQSEHLSCSCSHMHLNHHISIRGYTSWACRLIHQPNQNNNELVLTRLKLQQIKSTQRFNLTCDSTQRSPEWYKVFFR